MDARDADSAILGELHDLGVVGQAAVRADLARPQLVEEAVRRGEASLADTGALVALTGSHTGRSPQDKYFVREPATADVVDWGDVNHPMEPDQFAKLWSLACAAMRNETVFLLHASAGADPSKAIGVRVLTTMAWQALFAGHLFRAARTVPNSQTWNVLVAPKLKLDPERDGTRSEVAVAVEVSSRRIVIAGTAYAGEIKKSIFTVANFLYPAQGVMPMHCGANVGPDGDVALFFGLSGTGKTTLSADPERKLDRRRRTRMGRGGRV